MSDCRPIFPAPIAQTAMPCSSRDRVLAGAIAGACLILAYTPAAADQINGSCSPTALKYRSVDSLSKTTSTSFVAVPETAVGFTQGGSKASCVIVRFSAETFATSTFMVFRATLDNVQSAFPLKVQYSGDDGSAAKAHSYDFIFPAVDPGKHTVRMEYHSETAGTVGVNQHVTVVMYAP